MTRRYMTTLLYYCDTIVQILRAIGRAWDGQIFTVTSNMSIDALCGQYPPEALV
jgi:hypothetical protein